MRSIPSFGVPLLVAIIAAGCGKGSAPNGPHMALSLDPALNRNASADGQVYNPVIRPEDFVRTVDNPYLPLIPGTTYYYSQTTAEGVETNEVAVTRNKKVILGVSTTVVHDRVWENGVLSEDTFDWYAQHKDGTVWYFGEDTRTLDAQGHVITTFGSWEAGVGGAKPGIIMLAHPKIGDSYRQEYLAGVVEDEGKVVSLKSSATVPDGTFDDCVETMEWTPLEPGFRSHKFYARGVGVVLEESTRGGGERLELISVSK